MSASTTQLYGQQATPLPHTATMFPVVRPVTIMLLSDIRMCVWRTCGQSRYLAVECQKSKHKPCNHQSEMLPLDYQNILIYLLTSNAYKLLQATQHITTDAICRARVPRTRARSYFVMYGVVVRLSLSTRKPVCWPGADNTSTRSCSSSFTYPAAQCRHAFTQRHKLSKQ